MNEVTQGSRGTPVTLEDLHGGWPFGPGPDRWPVTVIQHGATPVQPEGIHLVCAHPGCGQSITRLGWWQHTWESLKPQVALHVMQVHSGHVSG